MVQAFVFKAGHRVTANKRGGKTASVAPSDVQAAKRATLTERLKAKADAADRGEVVSLDGLNDDKLIAALTRR